MKAGEHELARLRFKWTKGLGSLSSPERSLSFSLDPVMIFFKIKTNK